MREKILGLDIGISSIGWAVVEYNKDSTKTNDNAIIDSGVRIFTKAENPKTGESLALPRRLARSARRTNKRKVKRMNAIKYLLMHHLNLTAEQLFSQHNIYNQSKQKDVWQLRDKALTRILDDDEFARVLTHIAKRRGYKSNRVAEEQGDSEGKKVLKAITKNKELLNKYPTIGSGIYHTTKQNKTRRNKKDDYSHSIAREFLAEEVNVIFNKQQYLGNIKATSEFKEHFLEIFNKQRDTASVDHMVGYCSLEKKPHKRAAKRSYSAEEFVTLSRLINTKIISNNSERGMTSEELLAALELCKTSQNPSYLSLKKDLTLAEDEHFKNIDYYEVDKQTGEIKTTTTKFKSAFIGYHIVRKIVEKNLLKEDWQELSQHVDLLNDIATIFSYHKNDTKITQELKALDLSFLSSEKQQTLIDTLIKDQAISSKFKLFLHLSIKALNTLVPHMKNGLRYDEAVSKAGYQPPDPTIQQFLPALTKDQQEELTNPVVKRAISQVRKVVNALIRKHGNFDKVHIELTRDIKKSLKDRKQIEKGQEEYQQIKANIRDVFYENYSYYPSEPELLKFRLWQEQGGYCMYSQKYIHPDDIMKGGLLEIDHILPLSRSLDNSMNNKVLCFTTENQNKSNQTPYEYFTHTQKNWNQYAEWIHSLHLKKAKRTRLLKTNFDENSEKEFRERNLNDTAYAARFIKSFIENNLSLSSKSKQKVLVRSGTLTSMLRYRWGLGNKNRDNHLHHAEDAIIVAFSTQSEVQLLSTLSAKTEGFVYTNSQKKANQLYLIPPIENIREEVAQVIDDIFVSIAPRKRISGAAHEDTIYSPNTLIANTKSDKASQLSGGSVIHNVALNNKTKLAKQASMPRIDIFIHKTNHKYYVVPIYTVDFVKNSLPNKAIVSGKNKDGTSKEWLEMDDNYQFLFSVYKDELLEIKRKTECILGYFIQADSATASLTLKSHNNTEQLIFKRDSSNMCIRILGIQSALYIKKFQVDPLGNYHEIKKEKRQGSKKQI